MASNVTQTTIIDRALQILGYKSVSSINSNDRGARAMLRAYTPVKEAMLRENFWSFSIKRAILPAAATKPLFGKGNYFLLPGDFLMIAPPDQFTSYIFGGVPFSGPIPTAPNTGNQANDWQIEKYPGGGKAIATDCSAPLYMRYVSNDLTESDFDPTFAEAFSACLALETCEELTQSNTKLQNIEKMYDDMMKMAKQRNCFEQMPVQPPIDPWILVRM